mgnify:CR=1 FL=1
MPIAIVGNNFWKAYEQLMKGKEKHHKCVGVRCFLVCFCFVFGFFLFRIDCSWHLWVDRCLC